MAKPWHGFRETLNCGHMQLTERDARIGQITACYLCPLNIHNQQSPGVPVTAVRVIVDIIPVEAPQKPDSWGSEHWYGT